MTENVFEVVEQSCTSLKLDFSSKELAVLAQNEEFTEEQLQAIATVFEHLKQKKDVTTIETLWCCITVEDEPFAEKQSQNL